MDGISLKKGDVREFTFRNGKSASGIVADALPEDGEVVLFIPSFVEADRRQFFNTGITTAKNDPFPGEAIVSVEDIRDAKIKRGMPKDTRDCLTEGMKALNEFRKGREIMEKVRVKQASLSKTGDSIIETIRKQSGVLTRKEFEETVIKLLPEKTRASLSGYSFSSPSEVLYKGSQMYLTKASDTWICARDTEFCYLEYDGKVFLKDKAETYQQYKEIIGRYHKQPYGIGIKQMENLFIAGGYDGRIYYQSYFSIPKPETYTKEAAKEAALCLLGKQVRKKQR